MTAKRFALATIALGVGALSATLSANAQTPISTLRAGHVATFRANQIPAGATIACVGHGKRLVIVVPDHRAIPRLGSTMKVTWVRGLHLTLYSDGNTIFFASCS